MHSPRLEVRGGGVLRVMLSLLAYLAHNALYILAGLICFHWLKDVEEESTFGGQALPNRLQLYRAAIFLFVFGQPVVT